LNVRSSNETCNLIGWALLGDLVAMLTLLTSEILKLRVNPINILSLRHNKQSSSTPNRWRWVSQARSDHVCRPCLPPYVKPERTNWWLRVLFRIISYIIVPYATQLCETLNMVNTLKIHKQMWFRLHFLRTSALS